MISSGHWSKVWFVLPWVWASWTMGFKFRLSGPNVSTVGFVVTFVDYSWCGCTLYSINLKAKIALYVNETLVEEYHNTKPWFPDEQ